MPDLFIFLDFLGVLRLDCTFRSHPVMAQRTFLFREWFDLFARTFAHAQAKAASRPAAEDISRLVTCARRPSQLAEQKERKASLEKPRIVYGCSRHNVHAHDVPLLYVSTQIDLVLNRCGNLPR